MRASQEEELICAPAALVGTLGSRETVWEMPSELVYQCRNVMICFTMSY